jgi:hypothetical protein
MIASRTSVPAEAGVSDTMVCNSGILSNNIGREGGQSQKGALRQTTQTILA